MNTRIALASFAAMWLFIWLDWMHLASGAFLVGLYYCVSALITNAVAEGIRKGREQ